MNEDGLPCVVKMSKAHKFVVAKVIREALDIHPGDSLQIVVVRKLPKPEAPPGDGGS